MARPAANADRPPAAKALFRLPPAPKRMNPEQRDAYKRLGQAMVDAGTLSGSDLPFLEDAAMTRARVWQMEGDPEASDATLAAFRRLHKEQLIQLGLTPAARRAVRRLDAPRDSEGDRLRGLLE